MRLNLIIKLIGWGSDDPGIACEQIGDVEEQPHISQGATGFATKPGAYEKFTSIHPLRPQ